MKRLENIRKNEYRWKKPDGGYEYWIITVCVRCGETFLKSKYSSRKYCGEKCRAGQPGRPIGYKVSDKTKARISEGKQGYRHPEEIKQKIAQKVKETGWATNNTKTGKESPSWKHGEVDSYYYKRWMIIKQWIWQHNQKHPDSPIKMGYDWQDYMNFKQWCIENGVKKGYTINRVHKDGDYCPNNCVVISTQDANIINNRRI